MFKFFTENNSVSQNQSDFKQVILVLTSSCQLRIKNKNLWWRSWSLILDMSKAFDKVWHKDLIFKLNWNTISGNLLSTLTDFLKLRKQRVLLNGQLSSWSKIETGVPQGSILGPLLFLIYINNLSDSSTANARLFADEVLLFL